MNFFVILIFKRIIFRKHFNRKKYERTKLISEKSEFLLEELNEREEAFIPSYSATGRFFESIYSVFVAKIRQKILQGI